MPPARTTTALGRSYLDFRDVLPKMVHWTINTVITVNDINYDYINYNYINYNYINYNYINYNYINYNYINYNYINYK